MPFGNAVTGTAFGVLNEFIGLLRSDDGYARNNRYEVILIPPTGARSTNGQPTNAMASEMSKLLGDGTVRKASLRCQSIDMPGRTIDTAPDTNIYGPVREIAQGYTYAELTAVFQLSSDLKERRVFETWQRLAFDPQSWSMGYYDDYTGSIQIYQLDEQNNRRYGIELIECFPKTVGALGYAAPVGGALQTVTINFSFRYWKNLTDEASLPRSLTDRIANIIGNTAERQLLSRIPAVSRFL